MFFLRNIFYLHLKSGCLTTHGTASSLASQHGVAFSTTVLLAIPSLIKHRAILCLQNFPRKSFFSGSQVKLEHLLKVPLSSYLYAIQCAKSKPSSCHLTTEIACQNHQNFASNCIFISYSAFKGYCWSATYSVSTLKILYPYMYVWTWLRVYWWF